MAVAERLVGSKAEPTRTGKNGQERIMKGEIRICLRNLRPDFYFR